ncbi:MAG: hypothetical protein M1833_005005 [Piccolia ochrophora]|nr:MAG: hypothetical protein M1833_005005 [Piccolia ochrophora]
METRQAVRSTLARASFRRHALTTTRERYHAVLYTLPPTRVEAGKTGFNDVPYRAGLEDGTIPRNGPWKQVSKEVPSHIVREASPTRAALPTGFSAIPEAWLRSCSLESFECSAPNSHSRQGFRDTAKALTNANAKSDSVFLLGVGRASPTPLMVEFMSKSERQTGERARQILVTTTYPLKTARRLCLTGVSYNPSRDYSQSSLGQSLTDSERRSSADSTPSKAIDPGQLGAPSLGASLSDELRVLMRNTPFPVSVLTVPNAETACGRRCEGLTLTSLTPLSLHPDPLVTFNIRLPSSSYRALLSARRFLIHLLAAQPAAVRLAATFATSSLQRPRSSTGSSTTTPHVSGPHHLESGVRAQLECKLIGDGWRVADHAVVVAKVERVISADGVVEKAQLQEAGLMYAGRKFWRLGQRLEAETSDDTEQTS